MLLLGFMPGSHATPGRSGKGYPLVPADTKSSEKLDRLIDRKLTRLTAKYGEPFPEHAEIANTVINRERGRSSQYLHLEAFKGLYDQETHYLICAEMEKILWGRVRPEMESEIAGLRREMERLIAEEDERLVVQREAEERRLNKETEREEQKRREPEPKPLNMKGLHAIDWSKLKKSW